MLEPTPKNLLTMLGLHPSLVEKVSIDTLRTLIDKQFKALSQLVHPDHGGDKGRFAELNAAREVLLESPDILKQAKAELLRTTAVQRELEDVRWLLSNPDDAVVLPSLHEKIRRLLSASHPGEMFLTLRGVTYEIWDGEAEEKLDPNSPVALDLRHPDFDDPFGGSEPGRESQKGIRRGESLSHQERIAQKVSRSYRKKLKEGSEPTYAVTDAWKEHTLMRLGVREDGLITLRRRRGRVAEFTDKVIVGTTGLRPPVGEATRVQHPFSISGRQSYVCYEENLFQTSNVSERIPLSRASYLVRTLNLAVNRYSHDEELISLNFPPDGEPYFRFEGRLSAVIARRGKEAVNLIKWPERDGTGD